MPLCVVAERQSRYGREYFREVSDLLDAQDEIDSIGDPEYLVVAIEYGTIVPEKGNIFCCSPFPVGFIVFLM